MTTFEICAIVLTIGLLAFFIYISILLTQAVKALNLLSIKTIPLLEDSKKIAQNLEIKLKNIDPFFRMVSTLGHSLEHRVSNLSDRKRKPFSDNFQNVLKLSGLVVNLWGNNED